MTSRQPIEGPDTPGSRRRTLAACRASLYARRVFEKRGSHSEVHLSEADLSAILEAAILAALEAP